MATCMNEHTQRAVTETDRRYYHSGDGGRPRLGVSLKTLGFFTLMQMLTAVISPPPLC